MLYNGEEVGDGTGPRSTSLSIRSRGRAHSAGMPNAIAVIAFAERGTMFFPGAAMYMDKIAVGPEAAERSTSMLRRPTTSSGWPRRRG